MSELIHLLGNWAHWAFEIISGGVFTLIGMAVPERYNPVKRWLSRHDAEKHGIHKDDREKRMARLDKWLDELDAEHGPVSDAAWVQARVRLANGQPAKERQDG